MKSAEIRAAYLRFFEERGHRVVASSPLVPGNDPTLLFTNAGMVQFKEALLGLEDRGYRRAVSSQRCVRAGGKHNDLENVGYTARHHTFFEMLGNFSFADYFKEDAIAWAWEFATEVLKLDPARLWVTVHDSDDDAERIWTDKIGVPKERVIRLGDKDNFWSMGDTGPCGPCTEMFYDHGPDVAGGPPGSADEDGDRYIEFWNLVFPQFDRQADGTLVPLANPGVDTGMGLERVTAIMQGVHSNYEIDTFRSLLLAAGSKVGINDPGTAVAEPSLRVIADHIRAGAFLVTDGVLPASDGRGYVLRRIIRRALRHGHSLGMPQGFFHQLVAPLVAEMGAAYPELVAAQGQVEQVLKREEEQFSRTLEQGMELLDRELAKLEGKEIPGNVVFRLYDTYGFPMDLTADIARERDLTLDEAGFQQAMAEQRDRARSASRFGASLEQSVSLAGSTTFAGYDNTRAKATVVALYQLADDGRVQVVDSLGADTGPAVVVLDSTPFYAESGGQVGDTGELCWPGGSFRVDNTTSGSDHHLHQGVLVAGDLAVGQTLEAVVDAGRRQRIRLNHSATHLLHAALRRELGNHVQQKGSLVDADRLRFDFAHSQPVSTEELRRIEQQVNGQIRNNSEIGTAIMDFDAAREAGAMALFGEKYASQVRVLSMGDGYSVELCGGTHAARTGDIGLLQIVAETGIAAGVRRIEAVTGALALARIEATEDHLDAVAAAVRASRDDAARKVSQLVDQNRSLAKKVEQLEAQLASGAGRDLADDAVDVAGIKVLAVELASVDAKTLPVTLDNLKNKLGSAVILLASQQDGRVNLVAGVSKDLSARFNASKLVNHVGQQVGAKGGGRPDMARAGGGDNPGALPEALASVAAWVADQG